MENCGGEIITARYHLENLEKRRDVLEKEITALKDSRGAHPECAEDYPGEGPSGRTENCQT